MQNCNKVFALFLKIAFLLHITEQSNEVTDCSCWVHVIFRKPCTYGGGLGKEMCLEKNCCYDNRTHSLETRPRPFCYAPTGKCPSSDEQCLIPRERRLVCGHHALDRTLCELRGCCFDVSQQPICYYHKRNTPSYQQQPELESTPIPANAVTTAVKEPTSVSTVVWNTSTTSSNSTFSEGGWTDLFEIAIPTTTAIVAATPESLTYNIQWSSFIGYYFGDDLWVRFQCLGRGYACGMDLDRQRCLERYCCWNEDNYIRNMTSCFYPLVNVTRRHTRNPSTWGEWEPWSDCNGKRCTIGRKSRNRRCVSRMGYRNEEYCHGMFYEQDICHVPCDQDWTTWTDCLALC